MDAELQRRSLELFRQLVDVEPNERHEWLIERCDGNAPLFAHMQSLLAADAYAQEALQTGAAGQMLEQPPPESVGSYRITGVLGSGGMGVVYQGERDDGAFERTVAVKFMHHQQIWAGDDAVAERFFRERALLADMQHPNIAQLLDGGSHDGQPYLVMEFVDGKPFAYDAERPLTDTLAAFRKVCAAVAYAHNKLVLHRDLKPQNIMIADDGTPKLLDFGVAKLTESLQVTGGDLTRVGLVPLTLNYSAPECLAGEPASIASDLYSLGVCLYGLVNGQPPYDLSGQMPLAAHAKLVGLEVRSQSGSRDLDEIIHRAMRIEANERYASVSELSEDIGRYLVGDAVLARGADRRYKIGRFVRKYRGSIALAAAGLCGLLVALSVSIYSYVRAEQERESAEATMDFMSTMLIGANPWDGAEVEQDIDALLVAAEAQLSESYADRPDLRLQILINLTDIYLGRGDTEAALRTATESQQIVNTYPEAAASRLPDYWRTYGAALQENGEFEQAQLALERSIDLFQPLDFDKAAIVAGIHNRLGTVLMDMGEDDALTAFQRSLQVHDDYALDDPEGRSSVYNNIGAFYRYRGKHERALESMGRAIAMFEQFDVGPVRQAITLANAGSVASALQQFDKSEAYLVEGVDILGSVVPGEHPELLQMIASLSSVYIQTNQWQKAIATVEPALASLPKLPADHFVYSYVEHIAGTAYCGANDPARGIPLAQRAMDARVDMFGAEHWLVDSAASVVGMCYTQAGEYSQAISLLEPAVAGLIAARGEADSLANTAVQRLQAARQGLEAVSP